MKSCANRDIKALLPGYQEQGKDFPEREKVAKHLETCEDCRTELALLRTVAEEPVPDPGEAFWAAMPDRIYRQVLQQKETETRQAGSAVLRGFFGARWAWASAAAVVLAIASVLLLRHAPQEKAAQVAITGNSAVEDTISESEGLIDIDDFGRSELSAANAWAGRQLSSLDGEIEASVFGQNGDSILEDELDRLDAAQLDRLSELLNKQKREV